MIKEKIYSVLMKKSDNSLFLLIGQFREAYCYAIVRKR